MYIGTEHYIRVCSITSNRTPANEVLDESEIKVQANTMEYCWCLKWHEFSYTFIPDFAYVPRIVTSPTEFNQVLREAR